jgi:hypothetical protein
VTGGPLFLEMVPNLKTKEPREEPQNQGVGAVEGAWQGGLTVSLQNYSERLLSDTPKRERGTRLQGPHDT